MTENNIQSRKKRGRPFEPGNSGRPKGSRNRTTLALEALVEGKAEDITRKVIELGLSGNPALLKLLFERVLDPRREPTISFPLEPITCAGDAAPVLAKLVSAVAAGEITPRDGETVARLIEMAAKAFETLDLEKRLESIEKVGGIGR